MAVSRILAQAKGGEIPSLLLLLQLEEMVTAAAGGCLEAVPPLVVDKITASSGLQRYKV